MTNYPALYLRDRANQLPGSSSLTVGVPGKRTIDAVYKETDRQGLSRSKGADLTAFFELCGESCPDLVDSYVSEDPEEKANRLGRYDRLVFAPKGRAPAASAPVRKNTFLRLFECADTPDARRLSAVMATQGFLLNRHRARCDFEVRYLGPEIMCIDRGAPGGDLLHIVISGRDIEAQGQWGAVAPRRAGPVGPFCDLLRVLFRNAELEAIELTTELGASVAPWGAPGGFKRTLRVFVSRAEFGAWKRDLLERVAYGAGGNWTVELLKPGRLRLLAPSKMKGADHA